MKNITLLAVTVTALLSGCGTTATNFEQQNYRPKGAENMLNVEARAVHKKNLLDDDYAVLFNIDKKPALAFQLTPKGNGSLACENDIEDKIAGFYCYPHNGKKVGATCNGSTVNNSLSSINCVFEYDGEIAARFTIR